MWNLSGKFHFLVSFYTSNREGSYISCLIEKFRNLLDLLQNLSLHLIKNKYHCNLNVTRHSAGTSENLHFSKDVKKYWFRFYNGHLKEAKCVAKGCVRGTRGMHDKGACMAKGTCMVKGTCVAGGSGACMAGDVHGRGHARQGACVAGGVHCRGCVWAGECARQGGHVCRRNSHWSGRYTSYWNAFLF